MPSSDPLEERLASLEELTKAIARDCAANRTSIAALSQKYAKFNTRAWHMSHDLAGIRMDLSDVTDDIANISDAAEMINLRTLKIETELTGVRADVARHLANGVAEHVK